jgi:hypothetical protein
MSNGLAERIAELRTKHPFELRKNNQRARDTNPEELAGKWRALELKVAGLSFRAMAEKLTEEGYKANVTMARDWYLWAVDQAFEEPARAAKIVELARLDTMHERLWPLVDCDKPDLKAVDQLLKIMAYRARLTGLDRPEEETPDYVLNQYEQIAAAMGIPATTIIQMAEWLMTRQQVGQGVNIVDVEPIASDSPGT